MEWLSLKCIPISMMFFIHRDSLEMEWKHLAPPHVPLYACALELRFTFPSNTKLLDGKPGEASWKTLVDVCLLTTF